MRRSLPSPVGALFLAPLFLVLPSLLVLVAGVGQAAEPTAYQMTPAGFVAEFERMTTGSSVATLEAYGRGALALHGRERLRRLQRVVMEFQSIGDDARFQKWNGLLKQTAEREGDKRYSELARQNAAYMAYYQGDDHQLSVLTGMLERSDDGLVRSVAMARVAVINSNLKNTEEGLRLLSAARITVDPGDPDRSIAEESYWNNLSTILIVFHDLEGGAQAAARFTFAPEHLAMHSPDVSALANLMMAARILGEEDLARRAYQAEFRLAQTSGDPIAIATGKSDCAIVESAFEHPTAVLECLRGVDVSQIKPNFLQVEALSNRGLANAQLGRRKLAEADLVALKRLQSTGTINTFAFKEVPLIEAQLLARQGKAQEALALESGVWRADQRKRARQFHKGISQLTGLLQSDLKNLRRNAELQDTVIRFQWLFGGLGVLVAGAATFAIFSRRRLNREYARAKQVAEDANAAKSLFLANVSHEIRTP